MSSAACFLTAASLCSVRVSRLCNISAVFSASRALLSRSFYFPLRPSDQYKLKAEGAGFWMSFHLESGGFYFTARHISTLGYIVAN
jgi:hypothetical protein